MAGPARCCLQALKDATKRWPRRNKKSDGIMGDAAHQKRPSDHNLGNAFDLTHDPGPNGPDCEMLSRLVINDKRVTYVIWNRQIYNRARADEGWRAYTKSNPHTKHMHVSIMKSARDDDRSPWPWSITPNWPLWEPTPLWPAWYSPLFKQRWYIPPNWPRGYAPPKWPRWDAPSNWPKSYIPPNWPKKDKSPSPTLRYQGVHGPLITPDVFF